MRDFNAISKERQELDNEVQQYYDTMNKEAENRKNNALDNRNKLFNQITKLQVAKVSGQNNMHKEFNMNKKFMDKIKADILFN